MRIERWILGLCAGFGTIVLGYVFWPRDFTSPLPELGSPVSINRHRSEVRAVFQLKDSHLLVSSRIEYRLKNRGFKYSNTYRTLRRNEDEFVTIFPGTWKHVPNVRGLQHVHPSGTTVLYTVRHRDWSRFWRRIRRDWDAKQQQRLLQVKRS